MLNKIVLEGEVIRTSWGSDESKGFFVTIKQVRKFGNFQQTDNFNIFANKPFANELEKNAIVGKNLAIEGVLRTYKSKNGESKVSIEVTQIIHETISERTVQLMID